jgi:hypothetical protein
MAFSLPGLIRNKLLPGQDNSRPFTGTGKKLANPDPPAGGTAPNQTTEPLATIRKKLASDSIMVYIYTKKL